MLGEEQEEKLYCIIAGSAVRLKLLVKVNFFNVDAKRLLFEFSNGVPAGYRQGRQGREEKKEMLN
jgi:hypothetical protein